MQNGIGREAIQDLCEVFVIHTVKIAFGNDVDIERIGERFLLIAAGCPMSHVYHPLRTFTNIVIFGYFGSRECFQRFAFILGGLSEFSLLLCPLFCSSDIGEAGGVQNRRGGDKALIFGVDIDWTVQLVRVETN